MTSDPATIKYYEEILKAYDEYAEIIKIKSLN